MNENEEKNCYENEFQFDNYLISPLDYLGRKSMDLQHLKKFGYETRQEFLKNYPNFPTLCKNSANNIKQIGEQIHQKNLEEYLKNPKYCEQCDNIIPWENRHGRFCGHSCSASFNNVDKKLSDERKNNISEGIIKYLQANPKKPKKQPKPKPLRIPKPKGRPKTRFPYCKIFFKICEVTGLVYCNRNQFGAVRQKSPYIQSMKDIYYALSKFRFNVYQYPEYFDLTLVEEYGWYQTKISPKNITGASRDHLFSINEGFNLGINPKLLAHPANCEIKIHSDNFNKGSDSSMNLNQLLEKIKIWDEKYGPYYNAELPVIVDIAKLIW